ncbi:MAG: hypothetical protein KJ011_04190 [Burkholderiaceae bacterium]|nr:hypothetical protein [Burkholderiaceae bacterium]
MINPPANVCLGFAALVASVGGTKAAARILHTSTRTVRRWCDDQAPYLAAALLWWSSPLGRESIAIDERNLIASLYGLTDALSRRLAATEREVHALRQALACAGGAVAANDPIAYIARAPVPPFRAGFQPADAGENPSPA